MNRIIQQTEDQTSSDSVSVKLRSRVLMMRKKLKLLYFATQKVNKIIAIVCTRRWQSVIIACFFFSPNKYLLFIIEVNTIQPTLPQRMEPKVAPHQNSNSFHYFHLVMFIVNVYISVVSVMNWTEMIAII